MSVMKNFTDRYISKLTTCLLTDDIINKFLWYNTVKDEDIYDLPKIDNPVSELKDKKVFVNRRVESLFLDSDISVFINLFQDQPAYISSKRSNKINTLTLEVGVICHKDCRKTLNGARELIVANRIQYLLRNTEYLEAIGAPELSATKQSYNIPYDYNAYIVSVTIDYFESM